MFNKIALILLLTLFSTLSFADEAKKEEMTEEELVAYMEQKFLPPRKRY